MQRDHRGPWRRCGTLQSYMMFSLSVALWRVGERDGAGNVWMRWWGLFFCVHAVCDFEFLMSSSVTIANPADAAEDRQVGNTRTGGGTARTTNNKGRPGTVKLGMRLKNQR